MRYSLKTLNGGSGFKAEEEIECRDLSAARCQAIHFAADYLLGEPAFAVNDVRVEIEDDQGRLVATVIVLAIDAKSQGETIHISRKAASAENREPLFALGSGHAWRKKRDQNT